MSASVGVLTGVELRKSVDTRSGRWTLAAVAALGVLAVVAVVAFVPVGERAYGELVQVALLPVVVLTPVLGILAVTSEYSQRTALATFTLVPVRHRVMVAKLAAVTVLTLALIVGAALVGALANVGVGLLGRGSGGWGLDPVLLVGLVASLLLGTVAGLALGALLQSSSAAIVLYFLLPIGWAALVALVPRVAPVASWLDITTTTSALSEATLTPGGWARLGTSVAAWVVLPLALGTWRVVRGEPR